MFCNASPCLVLLLHSLHVQSPQVVHLSSTPFLNVSFDCVPSPPRPFVPYSSSLESPPRSFLFLCASSPLTLSICAHALPFFLLSLPRALILISPADHWTKIHGCIHHWNDNSHFSLSVVSAYVLQDAPWTAQRLRCSHAGKAKRMAS